MLDRLKNFPLIGLTLAIAGGLVLAHFANEVIDYLYLEQPELLATLAIATVVLSLIAWKRRSIQTLGNHKKAIVAALAWLTVGVAIAAERGGKIYTQVAGAGLGDYEARLAANRVASITLAFFTFAVVLVISVQKLIQVMKKRREIQTAL